MTTFHLMLICNGPNTLFKKVSLCGTVLFENCFNDSMFSVVDRECSVVTVEDNRGQL